MLTGASWVAASAAPWDKRASTSDGEKAVHWGGGWVGTWGVDLDGTWADGKAVARAELLADASAAARAAKSAT